MNVEEKKLKRNNQDRIGTRVILNLPPLEPIILGEDIGTKLILNLPTLKPIFEDDKCDDEILSLERKRKL